MEVCGENWVEVNSEDAAKYGIVDGCYVVIESPKDSITILAKVVEGLVPGCVSIRHGHGFGHWATLSSDGNILVVSQNPDDDSSESVYIYQYNSIDDKY